MASEHDHTGEHLPIDPDLAPADSAPLGAGGSAGRSARTARARASVLLAIALGAAAGAPARYGLAQVIHVAPGAFPWATFVTNISGSFLLGLFMAFVLERFPPTRYLRPFIATGFLGAYTTYSTFAVESDLLIKQGHAATGVAYAAVSLATGFAAVWAGIWIARTVPLPHRGGTS
ncbi:MAG TPA: fluoride efflux transporter CrcB [Acidimicrobiales bacterium]|nr:fluoride efflux transporter CrcB [Acidimicrobiales bacterium]